MSRPINDREGLSPAPPNILDLFEGEDDDDEMHEPETGESTTTGDTQEEESDGEYAGMQSIKLASLSLTSQTPLRPSMHSVT